jgi:hypothetical protein
MDSPNGLADNIRTGNDINNSDYRDSRTEWKYRSNSDEQLWYKCTADSWSYSNGDTSDTGSDKRYRGTVSGIDKPGIQHKSGSKCNNL